MNRTAIILLLALVALASAQYRLAEWVIDEGGLRSVTTPGAYVGRGSFHQTSIGKATDNVHYRAYIGYWHPWPGASRTDIAAVEITAPAGFADTLRLITPSARLANAGTRTATFRAWYSIARSNGTPVYRDSMNVTLMPCETLMKTFRTLYIRQVGPYVARCSVALAGDEDPNNDHIARTFKVLTRPPWPQGWYMAAPMPASPSSKPVRRGGWITFASSAGLFYAAKGNKTGDFYSYAPLDDRWDELRVIPLGVEGKQPSYGAAGASDGDRYIYALKGNNTLGFWRYDIVFDTWQPLPWVPYGANRKRVKAGADAVFAERNDTGFVYILKGAGNEFWRYNTVTWRWDSMPSAPVGLNKKWDKGSWLVADGERTIFAHKAKYHEFYRFDVYGDTWYRQRLLPMPKYSQRSGRTKAARDGSSAAWDNGGIYAFKGNGTQEFWHYSVAGDSWGELETIPAVGTGGRPAKIKDGADIADYGEGMFIALKGTKTTEVWRYCIDVSAVAPAPERSGVMAGAGTLAELPFLRVVPSPLTDRSCRVLYNAPPGATRLLVLDVAGRVVLTRALAGPSGSLNLDLRSFSPGVYFVEIPTEVSTLTQKLVVQR